METNFVAIAQALVKALDGLTDLDEIKAVKAKHDSVFATAVKVEIVVASESARLEAAQERKAEAEVEIAEATNNIAVASASREEVAGGRV